MSNRNLEVAMTLTANDRASKPVSAAVSQLVEATGKATKASEKQGAAQTKAAAEGEKGTKQASKAAAELANSIGKTNRASEQQVNAQRKASAEGIKTARTLMSEQQKAARARETLGIRSEHSIRREIQQTEAAYNRLARSGTLSAREQSRAYNQMRGRVAELRKEMQGVTRLQQIKNIGSGVAQIGAGITAGAMVLAQPVKNQMSFDRRVAMMANTAYENEGVEGRIKGKTTLAKSIREAIEYGGGTKESAAEALDKMLASGAVNAASANNLLPILQKYSTSTGASSSDLAGIAISLKRSFGIEDKDIEKALNMAIVAGQAGSFELADMAQYLPNHLAAAGNAGMRGLDDFATLLAFNQTSAITAGSSSEAGTNTSNFLAKITGRDTAVAASKIQYNGKGIDLPGSLAAAREKGVNAIDGFVGIIDKVVANDSQYQALQEKLKTAKGADRLETLNSMSSILEGSAVGKMVNDQQALKALIGYRANRDYAKEVTDASNAQRNLSGDQLAGNVNFEVIKSTNDFQTERLSNAKDFGSMDAMTPLSNAIGKVSQELSDLSLRFPDFTAWVAGSTDGLKALAAAAMAIGGAKMLLGNGGLSGGGGLGGLTGSGGGGVMRFPERLLNATQGTANAVPVFVTNWQDNQGSGNDDFEKPDLDTGLLNGALALVTEQWNIAEEAKRQGISPAELAARRGEERGEKANKWLEEIGFNPNKFLEENVFSPVSGWFNSLVSGGNENQPPVVQETAPINLSNITKLIVDGRTLAEVVNQHNDIQNKRGYVGAEL